MLLADESHLNKVFGHERGWAKWKHISIWKEKRGTLRWRYASARMLNDGEGMQKVKESADGCNVLGFAPILSQTMLVPKERKMG